MSEPVANAEAGSTVLSERSPNAQGWRRNALVYGPPAVAMACAWALVAGVALAAGYTFNPATLTKWDAVHYQEIANGGYTFYKCAGQTMWGDQSWCGNAGWLPLYPWTSAILAFIVRDLQLAAVLVTAAAFYGFLFVVWNRILGGRTTVRNLITLGIAALFPGALYFVAPYPLTLFLLFTVVAFEALLSERFLVAGLCGGLAAMTYSTGLVLIGVFGLYLLLVGRGWPLRKLAEAIGLTSGLTLLGLLVVFGFLQFKVGHWDAFFAVQAKYGYGLHDPLGVFLEKIVAMFRGEYRAREEFQGFQHLVVSAWILGLLIIATRDPDQPPTQREKLSLIYGTAFWLFPMVVGSGALLWRANALLVPTVALARRLSIPVLSIFLCVSALLCGELTLQYFKNWLP